MAKIYRSLPDARLGKLLFIMCWVAYFSTYLGRLNYSAAMPGLIGDGLLSKAEAGLLGTAFFACYGVGQFFCGFLGDKLSPMAMILGGLSISAAANLSMFLFPSFLPMLVIWGLNGLSQSMIWSPILRLLSQALPEQMRAGACVHINTTVACGTLCSYLLSTLCMKLFGWRSVFLGAAICMAVAAVFWILGSRRLKPALHLDTIAPVLSAPVKTTSQKKSGILPLLLISGIVLLLLPTTIHGALKDGITTWIPTYLTEQFALSPEFAVLLSIILPILNLAGAYSADFLNRKWIHDDIRTAAACFGICAIALTGLRLAGNISPYLSIVLLAIATASMLGVNMMAVTVVPLKFGKIGRASTVSGILNSFAYIGCAISMLAFGGLSEWIGWSGTITVWLGLAVLAGLLCLLTAPRWRRFHHTIKEADSQVQ